MTRHLVVALTLGALAACGESDDDVWRIEAERRTQSLCSEDPVCPGDPEVLSLTVRDAPGAEPLPVIVEYADVVRCDPRIEYDDPDTGIEGWSMTCGGGDGLGVWIGVRWSEGEFLDGTVSKGNSDCFTCWDITSASVD